MALDLDGSDDHVVIANEGNFDFESTDPFSVTGWVFPRDNTFQMIFMKIVSDTGWYTYLRAATNPQFGISCESSGAGGVGAFTTAQFAQNAFYHVVWTYDGSDANTGFTIYVDGVSVALTMQGIGLSASILNNQAPHIGANSAVSSALDGIVDDIRVYDRELTAAEAQTIFASRGHDGILDGLIGRWLMNEQSPGTVASGAGTIKDLGALGNNGTPTNSPDYAASELSFRRRVA